MNGKYERESRRRKKRKNVRILLGCHRRLAVVSRRSM